MPLLKSLKGRFLDKTCISVQSPTYKKNPTHDTAAMTNAVTTIAQNSSRSKDQQLIDCEPPYVPQNQRRYYTVTVYSFGIKTPIKLTIRKAEFGRALLDKVCNTFLIENEVEYFGLKYVDYQGNEFWIDPEKSIGHQFKYVSNSTLSFEYKHYPAKPNSIRSESAKSLLFDQLCYDIQQGFLVLDPKDVDVLGAHFLQAKFGDCESESDFANNVTKLPFAIKNTNALFSTYTEMRGILSYEAELTFFDIVSRYDTYGIHPIPAKEGKSRSRCTIGINHKGILCSPVHSACSVNEQCSDILSSAKRIEWNEIAKLVTKENVLHINHREDGTVKKIWLIFSSYRLAKEVWKFALCQKGFFTYARGIDVPSQLSSLNILKRRSKFKFSGRSESELVLDNLIKSQSAVSRDDDYINSGITLLSTPVEAVSVSSYGSEKTSELTNDRTTSMYLNNNYCENVGIIEFNDHANDETLVKNWLVNEPTWKERPGKPEKSMPMIHCDFPRVQQRRNQATNNHAIKLIKILVVLVVTFSLMLMFDVFKSGAGDDKS